jgi:glycosyltransferase involved in cell wall biosynthesis
MKVGIVDSNLNVCGGRELLTTSIIDCLRKIKCEILLLSSKKFDPSIVKRNFGLDIIVDSEKLLPVKFPRAPYFISTYWESFIPSLIRNKCNLIIDSFSNLLLPFVDVTYFHSFRKIGSLIPKHEIRSDFLHPTKWPNLLFQKTLASKSQKLILANSNFTATGIYDLLGIKPIVVYPPVNLSIFKSTPGMPKENIVLTISRFSHEKNLEILPQIAYKTNAKFVVLGSVYDEETLEGYKKMMIFAKKYGIREKVKVFANLSFSGKLDLLRRSKVYLHTMKFEDFGISIAEGMAASCIPIVHNSGGPREFVPKEWRYDNLESASQKIEEALFKWSPEIGNTMNAIAMRFSQFEFRKNFLACFENYIFSLHK